MKTKQIVLTGLFAALICVATMFLKAPVALGPEAAYYNLGDCLVIFSGVVLGPFCGFACAAIGSGLADIFLGSMVYFPATFIIKGIMALVVAYICKTKKDIKILCFSAIISEVIMVLGYFAFETALYGAAVACVSILGNAIQGALNIISFLALALLLNKNKAINKFFDFKR